MRASAAATLNLGALAFAGAVNVGGFFMT